MKSTVKIKALFFSVIFALFSAVLPALQSCAPGGDDGKNSPGGISEENNNGDAGENQKTLEEKPDGPLDLVPALNFNGDSVSVLFRDDGIWYEEMYSEAQNGDTINDAVYKRNLSVEERFNVKFKMTAVPGAWSYKDDFLKLVRNTISAGDNEFEIVCGYAAYIVDLTSGNFFNNWRDIPYLDFDKPWWNSKFVSEMTVNNKLYFLTGDLALSTIWEANVFTRAMRRVRK